MRKKERYRLLVDFFTNNFPEPETELAYSNPYELILAVVLSAQCTDKRVNMVTPALFEAYPTPEHLATATPEEIFPYIKSISYPNNKAKHLAGLGKMLVERFNGEVPSTVEELVKLPGVGRKTANVIVSVIWNQPAMAVDTHVFRVSKRIGLVSKTAKTPLDVEKELVANLQQDLIAKAHHWLILHGRYICVARRPKCEECPLTHFCQFFQKNFPNIPDDPENKLGG
ncbi:DNA-(apurinic or apyrimidinic site) lyase /endonuclease III [Pontibacter ummariensis]|uniref:Endonuclease III n=1 Tax=Pontibacter ummariensis TaxID=1610492 RepID=A0A239JK70_9BACT|nr:endonuclease III [Pontibacter ummariensis]PRY07859.1 DNA-(apurinic or apyrimidinic site) lyase /endonuclease III [Pontibacter ummariensis]SNT06247.1 DNA-(apurinic or apyrimidinic site) lyase /endonuclease III [Pontibacter ummariensis]